MFKNIFVFLVYPIEVMNIQAARTRRDLLEPPETSPNFLDHSWTKLKHPPGCVRGLLFVQRWGEEYGV